MLAYGLGGSNSKSFLFSFFHYPYITPKLEEDSSLGVSVEKKRAECREEFAQFGQEEVAACVPSETQQIHKLPCGSFSKVVALTCWGTIVSRDLGHRSATTHCSQGDCPKLLSIRGPIFGFLL